jgi:hypothetical protein
VLGGGPLPEWSKPPMGNEGRAVVVGAGAFGLYSALLLARQGHRVSIVEQDPEPFKRASSVNQARLHNGYHYPRSMFTAITAAMYFQRFRTEFPDAIVDPLTQIYAIASRGSFTDPAGFLRFCETAKLKTESVDPGRYFKPGVVDLAVRVEEFGFDVHALRDALVDRLDRPEIDWLLGRRVVGGRRVNGTIGVELDNGETLDASVVVNATYSGINQVLGAFGTETLRLKYEQCEVALVETGPDLDGVGLTVMDGPFFSLMPYGHQAVHSLTSVEHTPRRFSLSTLPTFQCQEEIEACTPTSMALCSTCPARPDSGFPYMAQLARLYMRADARFEYRDSLWTIKTVLEASEVDDGRPTLVVEHEASPRLVTVFSGKLNSVFDLEEVF